jgi:hypothetical protein
VARRGDRPAGLSRLSGSIPGRTWCGPWSRLGTRPVGRLFGRRLVGRLLVGAGFVVAGWLLGGTPEAMAAEPPPAASAESVIDTTGAGRLAATTASKAAEGKPIETSAGDGDRERVANTRDVAVEPLLRELSKPPTSSTWVNPEPAATGIAALTDEVDDLAFPVTGGAPVELGPDAGDNGAVTVPDIGLIGPPDPYGPTPSAAWSLPQGLSVPAAEDSGTPSGASLDAVATGRVAAEPPPATPSQRPLQAGFGPSSLVAGLTAGQAGPAPIASSVEHLTCLVAARTSSARRVVGTRTGACRPSVVTAEPSFSPD